MAFVPVIKIEFGPRGEVIFDSLASHSLDDPAPRMTSLNSIGCLAVRTAKIVPFRPHD